MRLTPFAGALQSFPRPVPITNGVRRDERSNPCLPKETAQQRDERAVVRRRLEMGRYLTKVREWTRARCKAFAASIAL
jgi:hypothetical protein